LVTVDITWSDRPRSELRWLFERAEDSQEQLDAYIGLGRVLVAQDQEKAVGHLQLIETEDPQALEIKSMAVVDERHGQGIGRALVEAALEYAASVNATTVLVSTATADVGNLRFYQRVGFRFLSIERDAFTVDTGYPEPIYIDGVPLRDRVWLSQDLAQHGQ
jgi:GNAT superfamily N-acetyltransferase